MKPSEILEKAADLIEPEGCWTQGAFARDLGGDNTTAQDINAACWCAIGAVIRVTEGRPFLGATALRFLASTLENACIPEWNDDLRRTQSEVVSAFRKSASLAKEQEAV
jgi:hypothetical protein